MEAIMRETPTEIVWGDKHLGFKAASVLFFIMAFWGLVMEISYGEGWVILFLLGLIAGIYFWGISKDQRKIEFNNPPGFMTVTYNRHEMLGGWSFFSGTKKIPMSEVYRAAMNVNRSMAPDFKTSGPGMVRFSEVRLYSLTVPSGEGTSFDLVASYDPELVRYISQKLLEHIPENDDKSQ